MPANSLSNVPRSKISSLSDEQQARIISSEKPNTPKPKREKSEPRVVKRKTQSVIPPTVQSIKYKPIKPIEPIMPAVDYEKIEKILAKDRLKYYRSDGHTKRQQFIAQQKILDAE